MWGTCNGSGLALTPLDKALTRFEPIQRVNPKPFDLWRLQADGRLGPLDLPVTETPKFTGPVPPPGVFYARVLPVLSASVKVSSDQVEGRQGDGSRQADAGGIVDRHREGDGHRSRLRRADRVGQVVGSGAAGSAGSPPAASLPYLRRTFTITVVVLPLVPSFGFTVMVSLTLIVRRRASARLAALSGCSLIL